MPPLENSEYAFILHSLEMLSTYGTAAIIVPHGVLVFNLPCFVNSSFASINKTLFAILFFLKTNTHVSTFVPKNNLSGNPIPKKDNATS
jgi:hypothetical protein